MKNYNLNDIKTICERSIEEGKCGSIECPIHEFCYKHFKDLPKDWEIQTISEPGMYSWFVEEDDGYNYGEAGYAENLEEAFRKATEYSPQFIKTITINKKDDSEM